MQTVEIQLESALAALNMIHVQGCEAGLLDGAIQAVRNALAAIDRAKKEVNAHENHNEQGKDV